MKSPIVLPRAALKKGEVCQRLGISGPTFERLVRDQRLRVFFVSPSSVRVLPEDLERFIEEAATIPAKQALITFRSQDPGKNP